MSVRHYKGEGIVIKKTPFGEADFLVRVFAARFGKMDILAKGARKPTAKLNAPLDFLNYIRFSMIKNEERLPTFTDSETIERFDDIFLNADAVPVVHRIAKTIDMILPIEQENDALLGKLLQWLQYNCSQSYDLNLQNNGIVFLREIFSHEGYGSELDINSLPSEVADGIIQLWPLLKN